MLKNVLKSLLRGSWESLLAVVLVAAFALAFMALFTVMFPAGSGLVNVYGEMFGNDGARGTTRSAAVGSAGGADVSDDVVGTLTSISRSVKQRGAAAIEWTPASAGMPIRDRQAIQTLARSGAVVTLGRHDEMILGANTLAVFTRAEHDNGAGTRRASLMLVGGEVRGRLGPAEGGARELSVMTAASSTTVRPVAASSAQFSVVVAPDKSSTFTLFSGQAQVDVAGKTLNLKANQAVTVDPSGDAGPVELLPATPEATAPADRMVATFGRIGPRVEFRWTELGGVDGYRLVVARDREFDAVVLDKVVTAPRFVHGGLEAGRYFWKVSGLRGKAAGQATPVRELELARDTEPPAIVVDLPAEVNDPAGFVVRGRTESGSQVFIDKQPVAVSQDGAFERPVVLRRGVNMIVIEAVDAAGNSAYEAKYVNGKF
jgi:mannose-6-phosphate isomerase-like protein (cupin superfamily)